MTGYQEILTDPSYRGQIVVMTLPHIGNYGIVGGGGIGPTLGGGFHRPPVHAQSFQSRQRGGLVRYLSDTMVPALDGLDTRAVVRRFGSMVPCGAC